MNIIISQATEQTAKLCSEKMTEVCDRYDKIVAHLRDALTVVEAKLKKQDQEQETEVAKVKEKNVSAECQELEQELRQRLAPQQQATEQHDNAPTADVFRCVCASIEHPDFQEAMTALLQDVDTCAAVGPVPLDDTPVDADSKAAVLIIHHSNRDAVAVDDLLMHFDLLYDIDKYDVALDVADIDEETACVFIEGNLPVRMLEMCASKRMHRVRREYDNLSVPVLVVDGARYTPPDLPRLAHEFREHRSLN